MSEGSEPRRSAGRRRLAGALLAALLALGVGALPAAGTAARAPARRIVLPPSGAGFSYQIGGAFSPGAGVRIVDRDRSQRPAVGRYGICYVNAFQAQTGDLAWWRSRHPDLLLTARGHPVRDTGWNEQLLDTSTAVKRAALTAIIGRWLAGCARAGYRAVEPDNLDSWTRSRGTLTAADNLALAASLIGRAHSLGLAIAQKNAAEQTPAGRRLGFDFAIAEECQAYAECGAYTSVYGRRVIEIEYPDVGGVPGFLAACRARGSRISIVLRDRDVAPRGARGFLERRCPSGWLGGRR